MLLIILLMGIIFISACNNIKKTRVKEGLNDSENSEVEIDTNKQSKGEIIKFDITICGIILLEYYQISEERFQIDTGKYDFSIILLFFMFTLMSRVILLH